MRTKGATPKIKRDHSVNGGWKGASTRRRIGTHRDLGPIRERGAGRLVGLPKWVKLRNTQHEQMSSALSPITDVGLARLEH
jgi:hypothetical protein